mmetsp:Transcript_46877/g.114336  ORF Transcript_46877/g.114336 Transcript_46877/m.114336 type:complete len:234 (-) Transcript_46877:552-1253(-)
MKPFGSATYNCRRDTSTFCNPSFRAALISSYSGDMANKSKDCNCRDRSKGLYCVIVASSTPLSIKACCNVSKSPVFEYTSNAGWTLNGQNDNPNAVSAIPFLDFFRASIIVDDKLTARSISAGEDDFAVVVGRPIQTKLAYPGPILLSSFFEPTARSTESIVPNIALFNMLFKFKLSSTISSLSVPDPRPKSISTFFSFRAVSSGISVGGCVESTRYAVGRVAGTNTSPSIDE